MNSENVPDYLLYNLHLFALRGVVVGGAWELGFCVCVCVIHAVNYVHRYNVEALHTKLLHDEELERAAVAAQQNSVNGIAQLAAQVAANHQAVLSLQQNVANPSAPSGTQQQQVQQYIQLSSLVHNVVSNVDRTLKKIHNLRVLLHTKKQQTAQYGSRPPPPDLDKTIQQEFASLSSYIEFANDSIKAFNHSTASQYPYLMRVVMEKRQELNKELEALKISQKNSVGGTTTPARSSQTSSGKPMSANNHGGSSSSSIMAGEVSVNTQSVQTRRQPSNHTTQQAPRSKQAVDSRVKDKLIARVAGSNEEKQMREAVKQLLVRKT